MSEKKTKQKKAKGKIVTVNCNVRLGGKALIIEYNDVQYITAQSLMKKLLTGTLETREGNESHSIQLGIIEDGEIRNDTKIWITKKKNAVYFVPEGKEVLIAGVDGFLKLLSGEWKYLKMGKFQD